MRHIGDFFVKVRSLGLPNEAVRRSIVSVIGEKLGIDLDIGDIRLDKGIATVSADAVVKSEIFMRKRAILAALADRHGGDSPSDIR